MRTDGLSAAEMMLGEDAAGLRRRLTKKEKNKKRAESLTELKGV